MVTREDIKVGSTFIADTGTGIQYVYVDKVDEESYQTVEIFIGFDQTGAEVFSMELDFCEFQDLEEETEGWVPIERKEWDRMEKMFKIPYFTAYNHAVDHFRETIERLNTNTDDN